MSKQDIRLVTAFFDISRTEIDGRTNEEYASQIRVLLNSFPSAILVTDTDSYEKIKVHHKNVLIIERVGLWPFQFRKEVNGILSGPRYQESRDITHKLPEYSLVNISKIPILRLVLEKFGGSSAVWLDAGVSRFFSAPQEAEHKLLESLNALSSLGFEAGFEIETRGNTSLVKRRIANATPGSCRRVVSGTTFFASGGYLTKLEHHAVIEMREWLVGGVWDNDQVLLRRVVPRIKQKTFYHRQEGPPASMLRRLLEQRSLSASEFSFSEYVGRSFSKYS